MCIKSKNIYNYFCCLENTDNIYVQYNHQVVHGVFLSPGESLCLFGNWSSALKYINNTDPLTKIKYGNIGIYTDGRFYGAGGISNSYTQQQYSSVNFRVLKNNTTYKYRIFCITELG